MLSTLGCVFLVLCFQAAEGGFRCPPDEDIFPCECTTHPKVSVGCDGMSSLASVQAVLGTHFGHLPKLQLTNFYSFSLPPHALGDLSPRKLYLKDSNIRNIDDDAFEGQSELHLLVLSEDRLEDVPTESLRRLTGLRTLSLSGNFLMKVKEESLSGLESLRYLFLSDNRISEIDRNAFPRNLKSLSLSGNLLGTLNGSLNGLKELEDLYARGNRLCVVNDEFQGLDSLQNLYLDRNQISDVPDLKRLPSLATLSLSDNRIQSMKGTGLPGLKFLNMSHNYISELKSEHFNQLRDLEVIDLSRNYLKSVCTALKPLRELRELRLSGNHLRRLDIHCFHGMKHLKALDLSYNHLMNMDVVFPTSLSSLHLHHNQLTSLHSHLLRAAKNLKELDIGNNHLSAFKFQHLLNSKGLSMLRMAGNPWKCSDLFSWMLDNLRRSGVVVEGHPAC